MKGSVELLSRVDHLLYATPDLNRGVEEIEELIGVVATAGGQHPGLGTRNALIALGPAAYLEIIAPDGPIATGTPPGHWIAIVSQIARNDELSLAAAAEAYARVGIAVHDAFISCWSAKYIYNLQRPVTYIIENIDAGWLPFIGTPAFPAYTSGHSTQSGAAAWVLTDMFGTKSFTDTTHTDHGLVPPQEPRTFASFDEAAAEAAISRLYGGIHFSFDNAKGLAAGQCTGQAIHDRVRFKRHHHDR